MEIKICKTSEWSSLELSTYVNSFNAVFDKGYDATYFTRKYFGTHKNDSYHSLLLNDFGEVVGGCSIMPMLYIKTNQQINIGLAVDVFIKEEYRTDPLMLRRLYVKLKKFLETEDVDVVIAVPNATSYPYWKNVVKWKDVGLIPYWIVPINLGNLLKKYRFINRVTSLFFRFWIYLNYIFSCIINSKEKEYLYKPFLNEKFYKDRFDENYYSKIVIDNITAYYRVVKEDNVITAYLINSQEKDKLTFKALTAAVKEILKKEKVDVVMYVGPLKLFQSLFFKVPRKFEPKKLTMTCDFIKENRKVFFLDMLTYSNWNFGLINYDVR